MKLLILFLLGIIILSVGCTNQTRPDLESISENCKLSGQEIQQMCNVKLKTISSQAGFCNYLAENSEYEYTFSFVPTQSNNLNEGRTNLQQNSISYEDIDNLGEDAIFYIKQFGNGKGWIVAFVDQGKQYSIRAFSKAGINDSVHCLSKEKVLELANTYVN